MKLSNFLTGLAIGAATGFAIALSTAPKSGTELRSNIKGNSAALKTQLLAVKQESGNVSHSVSALTNELKNNIPQIINEVKQSVTTFVSDIEPEKNKLQQEIEGLQNSISEIEQNLSKLKKEKKTAQIETSPSDSND